MTIVYLYNQILHILLMHLLFNNVAGHYAAKIQRIKN